MYNIYINELGRRGFITSRHPMVHVVAGTLLSKLLQFSVELSIIWNYGHINDAAKIKNEKDIFFTQKDTTAAHTIHNSMNPNKNSIFSLYRTSRIHKYAASYNAMLTRLGWMIYKTYDIVQNVYKYFSTRIFFLCSFQCIVCIGMLGMLLLTAIICVCS